MPSTHRLSQIVVRIFAYLRVSTGEQADSGAGLGGESPVRGTQTFPTGLDLVLPATRRSGFAPLQSERRFLGREKGENFIRLRRLPLHGGEACEKARGAVIVQGKEGLAVPAASAALALDHNHDSREPDSQASHTPSAPTPAPAPKKRGRPRSIQPKDLSPFGKWIVEDRNNEIRLVAADLGVSVDYLYLLINGDREPSPDLARKIFKVSNGKLDANALYLHSSK